MSDWIRPGRRTRGFSPNNVIRSRYDRHRVEQVLGVIAERLAKRSEANGLVDLAAVITEVVTPLRAKEHLPKDVTFNHRMRWHPVYLDLKRQKKVRGGRS